MTNENITEKTVPASTIKRCYDVWVIKQQLTDIHIFTVSCGLAFRNTLLQQIIKCD